MKSLRYTLLGVPSTNDDLLLLLRKTHPVPAAGDTQHSVDPAGDAQHARPAAGDAQQPVCPAPASDASVAVTAQALTREYLRESCILSALVGRFVWDLDGHRYVVEERYGSFCLHHTAATVRRKIDAAQRRFDARIGQLVSAGIDVSTAAGDFAHHHLSVVA